MKVTEFRTRIAVPMVVASTHAVFLKEEVWVCGVNKKILKEYNIEVLRIGRINYYNYEYLVRKSELVDFLNKHNLPLLLFKF